MTTKKSKKQHQDPSTDLLILSNKPSQKISKEQSTFNKLVARINSIKSKIDSESVKMETLSKLFQSKIPGLAVEMGKSKIHLAKLLHQKRTEIKLTNAQNEKLDSIIFYFLDDAFSVIQPNEEERSIYTYYAGESFEDREKSQQEYEKTIISQMFYEQFGVNIDPSLLNDDTNFKKLEDDLKKQIEEQANKHQNKHTRSPKKSKKQLEKEALENEKENIKNKSLRSIYLSLVKLLHPDTVQDEGLKKEKEETMKQVVMAYEKKDLLQLLQLEMQWLRSHEDILHNTDNNTLQAYIALLKEQAEQLEIELDMLYMNPAYSQVSEYRYETEHYARKDINRMANSYVEQTMYFAQDIHALQSSIHPTTVIKRCIEMYYDDLPF